MPVKVDLSTDDMHEQVVDVVDEREICLLFFNVAILTVGPFDAKDRCLDFEIARNGINVSGLLILTYNSGSWPIMLSRISRVEGSPRRPWIRNCTPTRPPPRKSLFQDEVWTKPGEFECKIYHSGKRF
ncbi:hypothetical protein RUE5091_00087 [Ruegeria denitrificans]|uniref:Uncharacterized protein n=1 Tax=Ruegeria denitrificans TaxID=1715692 RepID=A0A0P1I0M9_9RHOB|nr:hypothetical protein RUE5091_00087 [Ruegeria denitrificans]